MHDMSVMEWNTISLYIADWLGQSVGDVAGPSSLSSPRAPVVGGPAQRNAARKACKEHHEDDQDLLGRMHP